MSRPIEFRAENGASTNGEWAEPAGADRAPGLVVLQEYWGINEQMRSTVDRFAEAGFVTLAPDLYHGKTAANAAEAGKLMQALDRERALDDIRAAVDFLRAHPRCGGKVGLTGFCMGGAYSFAAACSIPGLSAVVPFYGVPPLDKVDFSLVRCPIQAHFAKVDEWAKVSIGQDIRAKVEANGGSMDLFVYEAGHAFMNERRPEAFDEPSASLAWQRTLDFLSKHLRT